MSDQPSSNPTITELLSAWAQAAFAHAFPDQDIRTDDIHVVPSRNPDFGDFQCNDAMPLAKALKQNPRQIAQQVADGADKPEWMDRLEVAGPGFLNIYLDSEWLAERIGSIAHDDRLAVPLPGEGRTVVLDYSSPNVAKPMHIGHIRSTIIGNSIDRMYRRLGYRVVADNHVGDWGTQFGIIIMGYRHFADEDALKVSPVEELERVYVKSYEQTKANPAWLDQCRQELVKLQAGDPENTELWKRFVELSLNEFAHIYGRLGVSFDLARGESYYNDKLPGVVEKLETAGLAKQSDGATIVEFEDESLKICIVRKRDGGFNYATSDIATVFSRMDEFNPDKIIYVTDERQQLHFRQFFTICRQLGCTVDLEHVWFGLMRLPEGAFSTRQGNVIKLEALLDEAESRALDIVRQSSPDMPEPQQKEVARAVGIGAVKYADLSQNPQTTVTFTWEKAMALDGNSGPYLQYACARIASVQGKYAERFPDSNLDDYPIRFSEGIERTLAIKLTLFPETVLRAARTYKPSVIAEYLYDLAQTYSTFYQNVPFLKAEEGPRESRVRLCGVVAKVLRSGLDLLGIETPERI